jgi:hypothetical protein
MTKWLILRNAIVSNIIEAPSSPVGANGDVVIAALSGLESPGDDMSTVLAYAQSIKQASLDAFLDANFDFKAFIRAGTVTSLTGVQVGTFIAAISNNYRLLRAAIAAAATVGAVNAININSGWPANP